MRCFCLTFNPYVLSFIIFLYIRYLVLLVDGGHRAVIFDRFRGVQQKVMGEGTHFIIPMVQYPIIYDCRSKPRNIPVITGSKGNSLMFISYILLLIRIVLPLLSRPHSVPLVFDRVVLF